MFAVISFIFTWVIVSILGVLVLGIIASLITWNIGFFTVFLPCIVSGDWFVIRLYLFFMFVLTLIVDSGCKDRL